jgi:predicted ArsR family transcriptional regulator
MSPKLHPIQEDILNCLKLNTTDSVMTSVQIAEKLDIPQMMVEGHIKKLISSGKVVQGKFDRGEPWYSLE